MCFLPVLGVGLTHNYKPLQNNMVIIADENGRFGIVHCHSASRHPSIGEWSTPSGDSILYDTRKGGVGSAYVSLELRHNTSLTADAEGMYHCTIPDEQGKEENLFVWIYRRGYTGIYAVYLVSHYENIISKVS